MKVLLTGTAGVGKTTLLRKVLSRSPLPAGGFFTEEIRDGGVRTGFRIRALNGREGTLAHVDIRSAPRVGRYGVDLAVLEDVGVASLRAAVREGLLVVVDEIGKMELFSPSFRAAVLEALDSPFPLLGTLTRARIRFAESVRSRRSVSVVEVTAENRDRLVREVAPLFSSRG